MRDRSDTDSESVKLARNELFEFDKLRHPVKSLFYRRYARVVIRFPARTTIDPDIAGDQAATVRCQDVVGR